MGPLRKSGIYVGYETMSIIRYLDPMTGDCHTARFADCIFDEDLFPTLGGGNQPLDDKSREITWQATGIHAHDPRTAETNKEVQKIIDLHALANQLPDHFSNLKTITKSHVPARNAPERAKIPKLSNNTPTPVQGSKRMWNLILKSQVPGNTRQKKIREIYHNESPKQEKWEPIETWHKYRKSCAWDSGFEHPH